MTDSPYQYWSDRLAGKDVRANVDSPTPGFYKDRNGKDSPWQPIAIFQDGERMIGVIGVGRYTKELTGDELAHRWNYFNSRVISEETYRALERGEPWPGSDPIVTQQQRNDRLEAWSKSEDFKKEYPIDGNGEAVTTVADEKPEHIKLVEQITEARNGKSAYLVIESDEQTARAQEWRTHVTSLKGKLDKARESLVRPHIDAQAKVNGELNPVIKAAEADTATVKRAQEAWEDTKRIAARRAQDEADRIAREAAEAAQKAAAAGEPEPPPPAAPPPPNTPPPAAEIRGATGRPSQVGVQNVVTAIDIDLVFAHFRSNQALRDFLTELAQKAVTAGITVPGTTVEEKSKIR